MPGFSNGVMYADNVDFTGNVLKEPRVTADGQLLIGSTATPNIKVGTLGSSDGSITWTVGSGTITGQVAGGTTVGKTITGDTGGALSPTLGNWNLFGSGSITTSGSGSTLTHSLTGLTNHSVLVGAGTSTITKLAVGTNGQVLIGATAADPAFATLTSSDNSISFTTGANSLSLQVATGTGVLKTLTGNTGGAISPTAGNINIVTANSSPKLAGSGSTLTLDFNLSSLALGSSLPSLTSGVRNVSVGSTALGAVTSASNNTCIGYNSGAAITTNGSNTTLGALTLQFCTSGTQNICIGDNTGNSISSGNANTMIGYSTGYLITGGSSNLLLGNGAGNAYNGSESNNICLVSPGILGESNAMRLGITGSGSGNVNKTFISGIIGATSSNPVPLFIDSSTEQLTPGTSTIIGKWTDVTGATQTLAVGNGYFTDRGGGVTYTLPATAALGDLIIINGKLGLTSIAQNANQAIRVASAISTTGVGGSVVGTNVGDCIHLRCSTAGASTIWIAEAFVGNWTVT